MEQMQNIKSIKTILVTNTRSFTDTDSVAADLAVLIAGNGKKVALIDADLRRPIIHTLFNLPNRVGLSDILQNQRSPLAVMHNRKEDNLSILTSGRVPTNYLDIFNFAKTKGFMQILDDTFDKIIIHGPPFFFTETVSLAAQVDGVVLLIHPGYNKTESSRAIIDKFQQTGATIIGIVMREQSKHQATQSAFIDRLLTFDKQARLYS